MHKGFAQRVPRRALALNASFDSESAREDERVGSGPARDDHDEFGTIGAEVLLVPRLAPDRSVFLDVFGHVEIDLQVFPVHGARDDIAEGIGS